MKAALGVVRLLLELALGLVVIAALAACVLGWRLAQGPLDVTWLVHRVQAHLSHPPAGLRIGRASLAWEGFSSGGQPLNIRLHNVAVDPAGEAPGLLVDKARVGVSLGPLLLGRFAANSIELQGASLTFDRPLGLATRGQTESETAWPRSLRHASVRDGRLVLHDARLGQDVLLQAVTIDLDRKPAAGITGALSAAIKAGDNHATIEAHARPLAGGTHLDVTLSPLNPAALSRLSPALAALAALDMPIGLAASAEFADGPVPTGGRLVLTGGPGAIAAGKGSVAVSQMAATLSGTPAELHLDSTRIALARTTSSSAPVLTATATATRAPGGEVHVAFGLGLDSVAMAELAHYWPAGTGGGARPWLVANVTAGRAHDAHVAGTLDVPADFSTVSLASLSGGLLVDDATLWWLRPVPPLVHVAAHVAIEGPDSLLVSVSHGSQDRLVLDPDSSIRITGLMAPHQFGDIAAGLSGPLADALALLNHPRLNLLSRGHLDVVDPAGTAKARLTMHIPLEAQVTMDDIPVAAHATLAGVHLGGVVGGRDLDQADLALQITRDGMGITGTGSVAGIPAKLALQMDFRGGPPDQVLQHLTASGQATGALLLGAGLPASVASVLAGGTAGLNVDFTGHRDGGDSIQIDADLTDASLTTPLGWAKAAGAKAQAGARVKLDHGRLSGVEDLHAEGPGLAIASHVQLAAGKPGALVLDRFQLGGTRASGQIGFAAGAHEPTSIRLSGPMLDLSSYLHRPSDKASKPPPPDKPDDSDVPGPPWAVSLAFAQVQLARGKVLSPFSAQAASDGLHILHADITAGAAGDLAASVTPDQGGRRVSVQAADAGVVLRALGIADNLKGGSLQLDGQFEDTRPGRPLTGTATLEKFQLTQAPAIGRLMQGMTLYGLLDALRGPGLRFSKLVAPFRWQDRVLHLTNARAFSPSLGITAQGDIDLRRHVADVKGTVVPAYFFNQLLGNLPLVGRIFSPEKGGGVFAARYSVRGPLANPRVGVNPLAALTPGFLREGFGLFAPKAEEPATPK